jgi:hypothetical protein
LVMIERSELNRSLPARGGWEGRVFNSSFACFVIGRAALLLQKFGSGAFYAAPELSIRST